MIQEHFKRLREERSGNFGIMAALAAVPLVMGVGMALDYATMSRVRSELQQATDAAVLAVAREGQRVTQAEAERIANNLLKATLTQPYDQLQVQLNTGEVRVSARVNAGLAFGKILNFSDGSVKTASVAETAEPTYEIGLVLDTTGSMKGRKLELLKDAATTLVNNLSGGSNNPQMRFALVPFANFVNVGSDKAPRFDEKTGKQIPGTGASWLDLEGKVEMPQSEFTKGVSRFQLYRNLDKAWPGCVETRYDPKKPNDNGKYENNDVNDLTPSQNKDQEASLFVPAFWPDEPKEGRLNNYSKLKEKKNGIYQEMDVKPYSAEVSEKIKRWSKYRVPTDTSGTPQPGLLGLVGGVLQSVGGLLDGLLGGLLGGGSPPKLEFDYSADANGQTKGPGKGCVTKPIVPLTSNINTITTAIDGLEAKGSTNISEGISWGIRVLSPGEPFAEGLPSTAPNLRKIMIVLTDGANQINTMDTGGGYLSVYGSEYSSYGFINDKRAKWGNGGLAAVKDVMTARTEVACMAAEAAGIEMYTIRLEEKDTDTGDMLAACASGPDHYLDVPDARRLGEAFNSIRLGLTSVRLTQ